MVEGKLFDLACEVGRIAVEEGNDASVFGAFAQSFVVLLVERSDFSLRSLFVQAGIDPFEDGEFLVNTIVKREFIDFLGTIFVETDAGISRELDLIFKFVVVGFSQVDLGNFDLSLQFGAHQLPFAIELNAVRVVAFVEVNEEGISRRGKG